MEKAYSIGEATMWTSGGGSATVVNEQAGDCRCVRKEC